MGGEVEYYLRMGLFVPNEYKAMKDAGRLIYSLTGKSHTDIKSSGLVCDVSRDLDDELTIRTAEKPSHKNEVAFSPELFIPDSANLPLHEQDEIVREWGEQQKKDLGLVYVESGISRIADYEEVILRHFNETGLWLLNSGDYPYLSAITRTRVFLDLPGSMNFVPFIGPFEERGLRIAIISREEADPQIGVWAFLYPLHISIY